MKDGWLIYSIFHPLTQAARLSAFQRRVDALAVSVVFSAGLEQVWNQHSTSFPKKKVEQGDSGRPGYTSTSAESPHPTGLDCFPTVFSCPQNIPDHLFPGLVSTLFNEDKCEYILSKQIEFWMRKKYYCYWIREAVKNYLADFFR